MSWDRPKSGAAPSTSTDVSTPDCRGSESPLGMDPNIAFNGPPWGWELLLSWGISSLQPKNYGKFLPRSAGINLGNHSLIYLFGFFGFFLNFTTTGHPTGLAGSCKIPINQANIFASSVSFSLSFFSAFLYNKHSQMDFFFFCLNLQGKMTNFCLQAENSCQLSAGMDFHHFP